MNHWDPLRYLKAIAMVARIHNDLEKTFAEIRTVVALDENEMAELRRELLSLGAQLPGPTIWVVKDAYKAICAGVPNEELLGYLRERYGLECS